MKRLLIFVALVLSCLLSDVTEAYSQGRRGVVTSSYTEINRTRIQKEPIKIKWQNSVDLTYCENIGVTYTGGWRFGNFMYLGFGAGIKVNLSVVPWDDNDMFNSDKLNIEGYPTIEEYHTYYAGRIQIPVYVHMKFRFMKTKVSPYLSASGGFHIYRSMYNDTSGLKTLEKGGIHCGGYAEGMIGVDFRLKNDSNISLGLGPWYEGMKENGNVYYTGSYNFDNEPVLFGIKLGYLF